MEDQPLVSIIVLTYNSASFVMETLESIKQQSYREIELIIADDASRDGTVDLCRKWINDNKDIFVSAVLVESACNGGIVQNCNNGLHIAKGEWIKLIAGDDSLLENCIMDFVRYVRENGTVGVVFSDLYIMNGESKVMGEFPSRADFYNYPKEKQLAALVYDNLLPAAAGFINKAVLLKEGGFDPAYPMMEDYPLWIKLLSGGHRIGYLPAITVCYRINSNTVSYSPNKMNPVFVKSRMDFARDVRLPLARRHSRSLERKVRRDIVLTNMRQHFPCVYKSIVPVLWWGWTKFKKMRPTDI